MEVSKRLCEAIQRENLEGVKKYLKEGADPLMRIDYETYFTPWNWLYSCQDIAITSLVLEKGKKAVNYQIPELCDVTLIFGAVLFQDPAKILLLIREGADINMINENGYTPLYYTIEQSKECRDLIPLLIELGADITIGCKKIKEFDQESEGMKDFYSHIMKLLEGLEAKNDSRRLKIHTDRLLKIQKKTNQLPQDLLEKIEEIRDIYELD